LYGSGGSVGVEGNGDDKSDGGIGGRNVKTGKVEEVILLSLSLLYSSNNISICSCPIYTSY